MPPAAPRDSQPLAGQSASGQSPIFRRDEAGDLQIVEIGDIHSPDFAQYSFGDPYPGLVANDGLGTVLYGTFVLVDWQPLKYPMAERIWQALPGSWTYSISIDKDNSALTVLKRRKNRGEDIPVADIVSTPTYAAWASVHDYVEGDTVAAGSNQIAICTKAGKSGGSNPAWGAILGAIISDGTVKWMVAFAAPNILTCTRRQDTDNYGALEIVEIIYDSPYDSLANAIHSQRTKSYAMPSRLNIPLLRATGLKDTAHYRPSAKDILCEYYEWWVISDTKPTVPSDPIIPANGVSVNLSCLSGGTSAVNVGTFDDVLIDGYTEYYTYSVCGASGARNQTYQSSTPSASGYEGGTYHALTCSPIFTSGSNVIGGTITGLAVGDVITTPVGDVIVATVGGSPTLSAAYPTSGTSPDTVANPVIFRPGAGGWKGTYKIIESGSEPMEGGKRWKCYAMTAQMY